MTVPLNDLPNIYKNLMMLTCALASVSAMLKDGCSVCQRLFISSCVNTLEEKKAMIKVNRKLGGDDGDFSNLTLPLYV